MWPPGLLVGSMLIKARPDIKITKDSMTGLDWTGHQTRKVGLDIRVPHVLSISDSVMVT